MTAFKTSVHIERPIEVVFASALALLGPLAGRAVKRGVNYQSRVPIVGCARRSPPSSRAPRSECDCSRIGDGRAERADIVHRAAAHPVQDVAQELPPAARLARPARREVGGGAGTTFSPEQAVLHVGGVCCPITDRRPEDEKASAESECQADQEGQEHAHATPH
jgi:hypothetical protein